MPDYSTKKLDRLLAEEEVFVEAHKNARTAKAVESNHSLQLEHIRGVGRSNDLSLIIATERAFVQGDLDRYANSSGMASSLKTSLSEISAIERHIAIVDDPSKYRAVDQAHSLPKNRKGLLPYDEARQAFASQSTRLDNLGKARLGDDEKQIIDARKAAISAANKLYTERQAKALGVDLAQSAQRAPRHDSGKDPARMADAVKATAHVHLEAVKNIPGLEGKSPELLNGIAEKRAVVAARDKLLPPAERAASLARFDKIATNPLFQQSIQQEPAAESKTLERARPQTRGADEQSL